MRAPGALITENTVTEKETGNETERETEMETDTERGIEVDRHNECVRCQGQHSVRTEGEFFGPYAKHLRVSCTIHLLALSLSLSLSLSVSSTLLSLFFFTTAVRLLYSKAKLFFALGFRLKTYQLCQTPIHSSKDFKALEANV